MNNEEYLDYLLVQHLSGEQPFSSLDEMLASMRAAARTLTRLQEIAIPPEFAHRVERSIRTSARDLIQREKKQ